MKLVSNLRAVKRYKEAASLCEHYLKDYQQSGQCLIENLCFSEAWALTKKYDMKEWAGKNYSVNKTSKRVSYFYPTLLSI